MDRTGRATTGTTCAGAHRLVAAIAAVTLGGLAVFAAVAPGAAATTKPAAQSAIVVATATTAEGSTILVVGTPVYTLAGKGAACTGKCLTARPPVLLPHGANAATAGAGVDAAQLGTARAAHGARQVTYAGKRLYRSAKDSGPAVVRGNGHDKWGTWSTVAVAASPATTAAPTPTAAPETAPPATQAPETAPPATAPPATEAPAPKTDPPPAPTTQPRAPGSGGAAF